MALLTNTGDPHPACRTGSSYCSTYATHGNHPDSRHPPSASVVTTTKPWDRALPRSLYVPWARSEHKGADQFIGRLLRVFPDALLMAITIIDVVWVEHWWLARLQTLAHPAAEGLISKTMTASKNRRYSGQGVLG